MDGDRRGARTPDIQGKPVTKPRPKGTGKYVPTQTTGSRNKPAMTKSEMYEDLRKAVENTK